MNQHVQQEVYIVRTLLAEVHVKARSRFEAEMWALNRTGVDATLCTLGMRLPHYGPICEACQRCYVHCKCPREQC